MILAIGIDAVEIERFKDFHRHPNLKRLFSPAEIAYCLQEPTKTAERFAARFAAKEALYKALTQALGTRPAPFLTLCAHAQVATNPAPQFVINWNALNTFNHSILLSITHTKNIAFAQVLLQKNDKKFDIL